MTDKLKIRQIKGREFRIEYGEIIKDVDFSDVLEESRKLMGWAKSSKEYNAVVEYFLFQSVMLDIPSK